MPLLLAAYLVVLGFVSVIGLRDEIGEGGTAFSITLASVCLVLKILLALTYQYGFMGAWLIAASLIFAGAAELHLAAADMRRHASDSWPARALAAALTMAIVGPAFVLGALAYSLAA